MQRPQIGHNPKLHTERKRSNGQGRKRVHFLPLDCINPWRSKEILQKIPGGAQYLENRAGLSCLVETSETRTGPDDNNEFREADIHSLVSDGRRAIEEGTPAGWSSHISPKTNPSPDERRFSTATSKSIPNQVDGIWMPRMYSRTSQSWSQNQHDATGTK